MVTPIDEERALTGVEMIAHLDETVVRSTAEDPCVVMSPEGLMSFPIATRGARREQTNCEM
jgi:hypothetical protein